ncbi:MAG: (Fe-S)-binding protein [Pseudomonadota bacterium]
MNTDFLIREADRCVKCGLCLPHCPTYLLARDEAESPRGRIALIQGWASGALNADRPLLGHLDSCLLCRRCEGACPSEVHYAALLDAARESLPATVPRWLPDTLADRGWQSAALKLAAAANRAGMRRWFPSARVRRLLDVSKTIQQASPPLRVPLKERYAAVGTEQAEVALFTGCMGEALDRTALEAAVAILTASGVSVSIPPSQQCCGAIHAHAGYHRAAGKYRAANLAAFTGTGIEALLTVSSGCGSWLADSAGLDVPVMDAAAFIQQRGGIGALPLAEVRRTIATFMPCSLAVMQQQKPVMTLLSDLPGAELLELEGMGCCGGAGLNLITQPDSGEQLVKPLIEQLAASKATVVATTNSGCALQLQQAAGRAGLGISVVHPLQLVSEQLEKRHD